ncbi:ACP phosphodiesterase [Kribbella sp. ALI-6-A]|uniref:FMN-dependent NADH-azoreductase n=1 Tax=Kribbella sp. ALI-6-A TaxID=1933817 RepID=UPI00097BE404|nr:NAD(P)H-dependent oxidoreductase [Kribbella sp. ALI-6-A]ONI73866.1 ACP phosphodiesterase [Kribbella sp. ALI-6-A]
MSHLLHLDSSPRRESVSRQLTAAFTKEWLRLRPEGRYTYRDLAAVPIPHVDEAHVAISQRLETAGERRLPEARAAAATPAERDSWSTSWQLIEELLAADTVVIGLPMHNFSVPSGFKAWLDRIAVPPLLVDRDNGRGPLSGTSVVVATARGGAYGPGTPRAGFDHQEPWLRAAFSMLGLDDDLTFVHAELTKSQHMAHLSHLRGAAADSLVAAQQRLVAEAGRLS